MLGSGYVLDTTVTFGYNIPWRQVNAMLIEASLCTEGVKVNYVMNPDDFKTQPLATGISPR